MNSSQFPDYNTSPLFLGMCCSLFLTCSFSVWWWWDPIFLPVFPIESNRMLNKGYTVTKYFFIKLFVERHLSGSIWQWNSCYSMVSRVRIVAYLCPCSASHSSWLRADTQTIVDWINGWSILCSCSQKQLVNGKNFRFEVLALRTLPTLSWNCFLLLVFSYPSIVSLGGVSAESCLSPSTSWIPRLRSFTLPRKRIRGI